ncbi:MAG: hypothetical protein RIC93_13720 [Alphaproteobacteria bacterium]
MKRYTLEEGHALGVIPVPRGAFALGLGDEGVGVAGRLAVLALHDVPAHLLGLAEVGHVWAAMPTRAT